ncbi:DNA-directed RNA polymerase subunit sigma [Kurthia sp. 3B1D]|uniref:DNA-directed RNA polymerase subunit sigma n=1 Tax=Candidatus Kurthia intestinigallinarum TaxID=1562256 RepID=A0A433RUP6_9BACL|nr:sigma-70 family RNA polymerase sigma factor [Kurthia sp. 3B1D]RUS57004.1 DNA-directed RNA polymerase subunit sigma [Kurthia sp. 3B1D]
MNFEQIYRLYFRDVYAFMLSLSRNETIAEEITQQTFFKALQNIDQYKQKCKMSVWLCQIAKNTYFTYLEKQKRLHPELEERQDDKSVEQDLMKKENAFYLHQLLHDLEEPYKEVFTLRIFGELPFLQIGLLFGKTESWARVTFYRAKKKIQLMSKEEQL